MAPPLAELTAHAQTLSSAGDLVGARRVLGDVLRDVDADPRRATADLALAAALHARILVALGDPHGARLWAGFAHAAEERLHGPRHERTVAAAATHAAVLHRVGHHGRAAQVYHQLVGDLTALEGPDSSRVLAAEADLATAEHAAGHCTAARARLGEAWQRHRARYGDAAPAGIKMLARLGAMERECGRTRESGEHLALAQELCARYLPADHPLVRQSAALAVAGPSGRHVCGRVEQSSGPPSAPGPATGEVPGARPAPVPRRPRVPDPAQTGFPPDDPTQPPTADPVLQQPLYLPDLHRRPGGPPGRHTRTDPPSADPPATFSTAEDLLPVRFEHPAPQRSRQPFVLAAALVAGVATAAAVVVLKLPGAGRDTPQGGTATSPSDTAPATPATTAATPTPTAADPGAPTDVRLQDAKGSVTLRWAYPKGAEGPVLISGSREGQQRWAFQQLPAGSDNYVIYGLDENSDYCFTVAVAYGADRIANSVPVCTRR